MYDLTPHALAKRKWWKLGFAAGFLTTIYPRWWELESVNFYEILDINFPIVLYITVLCSIINPSLAIIIIIIIILLLLWHFFSKKAKHIPVEKKVPVSIIYGIDQMLMMTFTYRPIQEFVWPKLDLNQCTHLAVLGTIWPSGQ